MQISAFWQLQTSVFWQVQVETLPQLHVPPSWHILTPTLLLLDVVTERELLGPLFAAVLEQVCSTVKE